MTTNLEDVRLTRMLPPASDFSQYLLSDLGAAHLATFPLVAGPQWSGRGGGGELVGKERMVHPLLLQRMDLNIPVEVDMLMFPDGSEETLINMQKWLYTGR